MTRHSHQTSAEAFWPYAVENADAQRLIENIALDKRERTLPDTIPGINPDRPRQRFASFVPIAVNDVVARALLEHNTVNRKMSAVNIERLTEAMLRFAWLFNGKSGILPCTNQEILDLQHTLHAVIRAHETAAANGAEIEPILVVPIIGLDPAVFATIDDGRGRQTRDTLTVAEKTGVLSLNDVSDADCSVALRVMLQYVNMVQEIKPDDPLYLAGLRAKIPNYRAAALLNYFPQLIESLAYCNNIAAFHVPGPVISIGVGGVLHAIIAEVQSTTAANNFVRSLITGANLDESSPIYRLREQLSHDRARNVRTESIEKLAMCIRAWNMIAGDRPLPNKGRIKALGYKAGVCTFPIPISRQRRRANV